MKLRLVGLCLAVGVVLAAVPAQAAHFDPLAPGDTVRVTLLMPGYGVQEVIGTPPAAAFTTFCIDSGAPIGNGLFVVVGFSADITAATAYLYHKFRNDGFPPGSHGPFPVSPPTGLQEAIYWTQGDAGGLQNTFAVEAECAAYGIGPGCAGQTWFAGTNDVFRLKLRFSNDPVFHDAPAQDMLVYLDPDDPNRPRDPVPEPGSLFLLGSGLVGLATAIRRRSRRS